MKQSLLKNKKDISLGQREKIPKKTPTNLGSSKLRSSGKQTASLKTHEIWKEYFTNLLETALLPQIFVFWVRGPIFL